MYGLKNLRIQIVATLFALMLFGCGVNGSETEKFPPPNWLRFTEPIPPSFAIWVPDDWKMISSRIPAPDVTGPTAFMPVNNPEHVAIRVEFSEFVEPLETESTYIIEQSQVKAFCTRTPINERVTHECIIGPYSSVQYYLNPEPDDHIQVMLRFNTSQDLEKEYESIWRDVVRSFIFEQPLMEPQ